jgi:hypothetical protein
MEAKGHRSRQRSTWTRGPRPATEEAESARHSRHRTRSRHPRTRSRPLRSAGKNIPAHAALFDLLTFLKQRTDYAEASLGEIREGTGIDLNAHASLLDVLRENIKVDTVEEPGVPLRLRYLPAHGARWLTFYPNPNPNPNLNPKPNPHPHQACATATRYCTCSSTPILAPPTGTWSRCSGASCRCVACAWHVRGMCRACAGHVQGMCRACAGHVQGMCWACAGHVQGMCRACAGHVQGMCMCNAYMQRTHARVAYRGVHPCHARMMCCCMHA